MASWGSEIGGEAGLGGGSPHPPQHLSLASISVARKPWGLPISLCCSGPPPCVWDQPPGDPGGGTLRSRHIRGSEVNVRRLEGLDERLGSQVWASSHLSANPSHMETTSLLSILHPGPTPLLFLWTVVNQAAKLMMLTAPCVFGGWGEEFQHSHLTQVVAAGQTRPKGPPN